jgi:hypothetical protein
MPSERFRDAKFYSLARSGQKQLRVEKDSWARLTGVVQLIFDEVRRNENAELVPARGGEDAVQFMAEHR